MELCESCEASDSRVSLHCLDRSPLAVVHHLVDVHTKLNISSSIPDPFGLTQVQKHRLLLRQLYVSFQQDGRAAVSIAVST